MEANAKRPSGIGKLKDKSVEVDNEYIVGNVYDLSDENRQTEKFKYYRGEGNGYITDKQGHVYDVQTSEYSGDAGRIAGGSYTLSVTIKNIDGTNLRFRGFTAIMSRSYGLDIISDIKAGMYLEDYIAKHWNDISSDIKDNKKIQELRDAGDANAKTYQRQKDEDADERRIKFHTRYLQLNDFQVSVKNNEINIELPHLDAHYERNMGKARPEHNVTISSEQNDKMQQEWHDTYKKFKADIAELLKPVISDIFKEKFNCSLSDMNGVMFTMTRNKRYLNNLAFDTKKKKFVTIEYQKSKIAKDVDKDQAYPRIGETMTLQKNDADEHMIDVFTRASKEWMRLNRGQQSAWVEKYWKDIYDGGNSTHWLYGKQTMTKGDARRRAAENYKKELAMHDWRTSGDTITFMTEFISQFLTSPNKIETVTGKNIENSNVDKNSRQYKDAEAKMTAWHEGRRKQNVVNCSDAKLRMNYEICVELGYDNEAAILSNEITKRGLKLENINNISLDSYISEGLYYNKSYLNRIDEHEYTPEFIRRNYHI